jgi:hypothetical protein
MNCSWCGKTISIFRILADSLYCCAEHREQEREHTKRLAIERLLKGPSEHPRHVKIAGTQNISDARTPVGISFGQTSSIAEES